MVPKEAKVFELLKLLAVLVLALRFSGHVAVAFVKVFRKVLGLNNIRKALE